VLQSPLLLCFSNMPSYNVNTGNSENPSCSSNDQLLRQPLSSPQPPPSSAAPPGLLNGAAAMPPQSLPPPLSLTHILLRQNQGQTPNDLSLWSDTNGSTTSTRIPLFQFVSHHRPQSLTPESHHTMAFLHAILSEALQICTDVDSLMTTGQDLLRDAGDASDATGASDTNAMNNDDKQ
jgi:hypothetical protein